MGSKPAYTSARNNYDNMDIYLFSVKKLINLVVNLSIVYMVVN